MTSPYRITSLSPGTQYNIAVEASVASITGTKSAGASHCEMNWSFGQNLFKLSIQLVLHNFLSYIKTTKAWFIFQECVLLFLNKLITDCMVTTVSTAPDTPLAPRPGGAAKTNVLIKWNVSSRLRWVLFYSLWALRRKLLFWRLHCFEYQILGLAKKQWYLENSCNTGIHIIIYI